MNTAPSFPDMSQAHIEGLFELAQTAFGGVERLSQLNLQFGRAALSDARDASLATAAANDLPGALTFATAYWQSAPEKTAAYVRSVHAILSDVATQARQAAEHSAAQAQQRLAAALDAALKGAPAELLAVVKATLAAGNDALDAVQAGAEKAVAALPKPLAIEHQRAA